MAHKYYNIVQARTTYRKHSNKERDKDTIQNNGVDILQTVKHWMEVYMTISRLLQAFIRYLARFVRYTMTKTRYEVESLKQLQ